MEEVCVDEEVVALVYVVEEVVVSPIPFEQPSIVPLLVLFSPDAYPASFFQLTATKHSSMVPRAEVVCVSTGADVHKLRCSSDEVTVTFFEVFLDHSRAAEGGGYHYVPDPCSSVSYCVCPAFPLNALSVVPCSSPVKCLPTSFCVACVMA